MHAKIVISGLDIAEKKAREMLEHIEAIRRLQAITPWESIGLEVIIDGKKEAASGN